MKCRRCDYELSEEDNVDTRLCQFCRIDEQYRPLLRSNSIPSAAEQATLLDQIHQQTIELSQVEHEIDASRKRLEMLQVEQGRRYNRLHTYQAAASTIRQVPDDIWGKIFEELILKDQSKHIRRILSLVCSRWRNLLMNTPVFWKNIVIDFETSKHAKELFFSSTGTTMPLNITIHLNYRQGNDGYVPTFEWMGEYFGRILTLTLHRGVPAMPWSKEFPILESISFQRLALGEVPFYESYGSKGPWKDGVIDAPRLREVSFESVAEPFEYPIPWHQLTSLTVTSSWKVDATTFIATLTSASPSLEKLALDLSRDERSGVLQEIRLENRITLPKLTHIELSLRSDGDTASVLDSLTTPSLNYIALGRVGPIVWAENVKGLYERLSPPIEIAHIKDNDWSTLKMHSMNPGDIVDTSKAILSYLPTVTTIRVDTDRIYTKTLVTGLDWHMFPSPSRYMKVLYQRSLDEDKVLDRFSHAERLDVTSAKPAVVLVRSNQPIVGVEKVEEYRDIQPREILQSLRLRRVDIYL